MTTVRPGAEYTAGRGMTGLEFESGDVIAFYDVAASSIGPPWRSVWHRDPIGRWTIHTNIEPMRACPRYFGPALHAHHVDDIEIIARDGNVTVTAANARISIVVRLGVTLATRLANAAMRVAPARAMARPVAGRLAGRLLDTGPLETTGTTPAGHRFVLRPRTIRFVSAAVAIIDTRDPGSIARSGMRPALGGLRLPARALYITGSAEFAEAPRAQGAMSW